MKVVGKPRQLAPQAHLTLYRAVQEALNNTAKHAHATCVWVTLDYSPQSQVRLTVQDNGNGAANLKGGFGLLGLQERAHLLNGEFRAVSNEGEGVKIEVTLPG